MPVIKRHGSEPPAGENHIEKARRSRPMVKPQAKERLAPSSARHSRARRKITGFERRRFIESVLEGALALDQPATLLIASCSTCAIDLSLWRRLRPPC
jgi:hypothetical protein